MLLKTFVLTCLLFFSRSSFSSYFSPPIGGNLDPTTIPKYVDPLPILEVMPKKSVLEKNIDYYKIAVRQFEQQLLPATFPKTKVWGYGAADDLTTFRYPGRTIEAKSNRMVRVKWINELVDSNGNYLSHLLPIDQTLHWANPSRDCIDSGKHPDCRGKSQLPYTGPIPLITHVHGAHVLPDSDGYPEAWYLPKAKNIPASYAIIGSKFGQIPGVRFTPGEVVFQYPNTQRSATLWYHDHALGMTRTNIYTGLAGLYLIRDPQTDPLGLPKNKFEIPIVIQDKSFNKDGSLFFPDNRAFFEGLNPFPKTPYLKIPFIPETTLSGAQSDVSPIWNPEFFGNTIVVNGKTWPRLNVEQRRYRYRFLNINDTRVLFLKIVAKKLTRPGVAVVPFWQIGADGGFLPKPIKLDHLLIAAAERVDVIVDFTKIPKGTKLYLINEGPDEPYGGGKPGVDFDFADPNTTGQTMEFVVGKRSSLDTSTPPKFLQLPSRIKLGRADKIRTLSLNEADSETVLVSKNSEGDLIESREPEAEHFVPDKALLGLASVVNGVITPIPKKWMEPITENPALNSTEIWEFYDFTDDAHPIHLHQVEFEVINRQDIKIDSDTMTATLVPGTITGPEAGETGTKDTVLVYPGRVTRIKVKFDLPGLYVWHCHILSHEDNEMMRPICVGGKCAP